MDFVQGIDAAKLVGQDGALDVNRAVQLMLPVLGALRYAHAEGFVHRDIKPSNIPIASTPGGEEARLTDFGLARSYLASPMSGITIKDDHKFAGLSDTGGMGALVARADSAVLRRPEQPSVTIDPTLTVTGP
jgi:eukaryotic-like serine/threonine-protein kinase